MSRVRRAFLIAVCAGLLGGCAHSPRTGEAAVTDREKHLAELSRPGAVQPSPSLVIGRILAVDMRTLTAVVDLAPHPTVPGGINGRMLISRTDDLHPTAHLQASPYLRGRTLGVRLVSGQPEVGDEVVLVPLAP